MGVAGALTLSRRVSSFAWGRLALGGILLAGLGLGALIDARGIVSAQGAWRALRANQVWFGGMPSIRSLGYDLPPLPTLLEVPLVLLPPLRSNALAGAIVASLAGVLLGWSLLRALHGLGLGGRAGAVVTAAVLLNPLMLYAIGTGAGDVLGVALLVLGLKLVLDWVRDERHSLSLLGGAFALGLASLARYDLGLVAAALTLAVALLAGRQPGQGVAYAIAFGTPTAAVIGLWLVVNWLATDNPLTFAAVAHNPPALAPAGNGYHLGNGNGLAQFVLIAPLMVVAVPGVPAAWGRRGSSGPTLVLSAAVVAIGGWMALAALAGGSPGLLAALPLAPLSVLLLAAVARPLENLEKHAGWPMLVGMAALACVVVPFASLATRDEPGEGYSAFVSLLTGHAAAPMWSSEQAVGAALREQSQGRDVLLDDRREALPAFFVRAPSHLIATADPDFGVVLSDPRGRVRLILVRTPGHDDAIDAAWPRLYAGGVAWAEQVGEWPVSGDPTSKYRLFQVRGSA